MDTSTTPSAAADANPLLQNWHTPHGVPPFERIDPSHFAAAFEAAMAQQRAEIDAITTQADAPSFDNTLVALDASGRLMDRVESVFYNLRASESSEGLRAVERDWAPRLAVHRSAISLNAELFARVHAVWTQREQLGLDPESLRLLERVHLDFELEGALLQGPARERQAAIDERLAELHARFGQHVLADEAQWLLPLPDEAALSGLPHALRAACAAAAQARGHSGHAVALSRSLVMPFLTHSTRRDLREAVWRAWVGRGEHTPERDTRGPIVEIMRLRAESSALKGHATYADAALKDRMALRPSAVYELLAQVWDRALPKARADLADLQALADHPVEAWDWAHLAERIRQQRFDVSDDEVKPYFSLDRMIDAMFDCAGRLFGLRFVECTESVPRYHPDVRAWEVRWSADDRLVGLFMGDNFARPSKRGGAWMSSLRQQSRIGGREVTPQVVNNNNFAKAPEGEPTLLSFDDVRTLFHEFGHGLHGLLSQVRFERLSGTNVLRDFVELPSQLFEHWGDHPEVLRRHARHVQTGEPIPDALIARLKAAGRFNQAYETLRYTASALLDMALHSLDAATLNAADFSVDRFEREQCEALGVMPQVGFMHRLPHFRHLFDGGYAAGYYVYMWAEVLDADAFTAFEEAGDLFHPETAQRLLANVYSVGGSREPGATYRAFRGRDARIEPMLRDRGLIDA